MIKKLSVLIIIMLMVAIFAACGNVTPDRGESENISPIITGKISDAIVTEEPVYISPGPEKKKDNTSTENINNQEKEISINVTSHYENVDFDAIYNSEGEKLSNTELLELQEYLKNKNFGGLLYSEFICPEELSLYYTFYNMLDFSSPLTDEEYKLFYPEEEVWWDAWYNTRMNMDAFLRMYTGLSLSYYENEQPGSAGQYEEIIDGYLRGATDACCVIPALVYGFKNEAEITVWYKDALSDDAEEKPNICLKLKEVDGHYQFISNMTSSSLRASYLLNLTNINDSNFSSYMSTVETYSGKADVTYYYWKDTNELIYATQSMQAGLVSYYFLNGECFYIHNRELLDKDLFSNDNKDFVDLFYCNTVDTFTYEGKNIVSSFYPR